MNDDLQKRISQLPREPGVYLFRDRKGGLLYVGKARNLRGRVKSYFGKTRDGRIASRAIEQKVSDVEFVVTRSEKEALLLENNLIKKMKPRYNLLLRDDKTFFHLRIDTREAFPKIVPTRRLSPDGARYFGPYANAGALRRTLRFLRSVAPLRDCKDTDFKSRTRPCLEYEIGRCTAPCVDLISQEDYAVDVDRATSILGGKSRELERRIRTEMESASEQMQYERAATLRDYLKSLEVSLERQEVDTRTLGDADAVGIFREGGLTEVVVLFARDGKIVSTASFTLEYDLPDDELLSEFLVRFYGGGRPVPGTVLLPGDAYGSEALAEWLSERREGKVSLLIPKRGSKLRLIELAHENARLTLIASTDRRQQTAVVLEELRESLGLVNLPHLIECFDVSTTGGVETVASCVVFRDGEAHKSGYRHYRMKSAAGDDEYASMREALLRRYSKSPKDRLRPDLVIVDGGKGQWNAAQAVFEEVEMKNPDLIALVKGGRRGKGVLLKKGEEERAFSRGTGDGVVLDSRSSVTRLLQRIRDEAHRFAIRLHRKRRSRTSLASELDSIPLVGPKRKKILYARFGDVEGVRRATENELAEVEGIGPRAAREIAHFFGRT